MGKQIPGLEMAPKPERQMTSEDSIRVTLVRSGATAWDDAGRLGGTCDLPLSEAGREVVRAALAGLNGEVVNTIFSGPDEASLETAQALRAVKGGKVKVLEGLKELDFGLWEGLRLDEIEEKCPTAYRQWCDNPAAVMVPEGESIEEASQRLFHTLGRALERVRGDAGAPAVVLRPVAHALIVSAAAGMPPQRLGESARTGPAIRSLSLPRSMFARSERSRAASRR